MKPGTAISAAAIGKQYRIGGRRSVPDTLGETVARALRAGLRRAGRLARSQVRRSATNETFWALRDASFDVPMGQVLGVIGPNGSGKSTLLKILSRITPPTEGEATIAGRVGSLLEIGTGFHGELTGRENIYLSGTILGMKREEISQRFDEIVSFSGVEKFIDTPVKHYSSGMYLRLAFSVAANLRADILLIDEVLAVGDAAFQRKCLDKMSDVAREGRTVLFVSHNLAAVSRLCDSAIVLDAGRIVSRGSAAAGVAAYEASLARANKASGIGVPGSGGLAISEFEIQREGSTLIPGSPLRFRLVLEVRRPFWSLSVVFGLRTADEEGLVADVLDSERVPELVQIGRHAISIALPPLWLRPRTYVAQAKAVGHPQNGETERSISDCVEITICGDGREGLSDRTLQPKIEWLVTSESRMTPTAKGPMLEGETKW